MSRRVVITGYDCITPLGNCVSKSWANLLASKQCLAAVEDLPDYSTKYQPYTKHLPPVLKVGKCPEPLEVNGLFSAQDKRRMSPMMMNTIATTYQALKHADLVSGTPESLELSGVVPERVATSIGTGLPAINDIFDASVNMAVDNKRSSPMLIPKILTNMVAGAVSIKFNARGPSQTTSTACATGNNAIIEGFNCIKNGMSDVAIVGATEESLHPLTIAGFHRLKSLSNDSKSRPFDKGRNGFVISEGTGVMILEDLEHAKQRIRTSGGRASILGELVGIGMSSDAYHITSPMENGDGAKRSMEMALSTAGVSADQIGYVNAHATSTPIGDMAELTGIANIFSGKRDSPLYVSSNKGAMGHLLGASGLVESIFTLLGLKEGIIPHTLNLCDDISTQPLSQIQLVKNEPVNTPTLNYALTNSFGFGGVNTSLLFKKWDE